VVCQEYPEYRFTEDGSDAQFGYLILNKSDNHDNALWAITGDTHVRQVNLNSNVTDLWTGKVYKGLFMTFAGANYGHILINAQGKTYLYFYHLNKNDAWRSEGWYSYAHHNFSTKVYRFKDGRSTPHKTSHYTSL